MSNDFNEKNFSVKMDKSISSFKKDISTLRTGRANTNMLDTIKVDVYGQLMPVDQLATISVPEARLITIQVWDKANVNLIESAILSSKICRILGKIPPNGFAYELFLDERGEKISKF